MAVFEALGCPMSAAFSSASEVAFSVTLPWLWLVSKLLLLKWPNTLWSWILDMVSPTQNSALLIIFLRQLISLSFKSSKSKDWKVFYALYPNIEKLCSFRFQDIPRIWPVLTWLLILIATEVSAALISMTAKCLNLSVLTQPKLDHGSPLPALCFILISLPAYTLIPLFRCIHVLLPIHLQSLLPGKAFLNIQVVIPFVYNVFLKCLLSGEIQHDW